jgi:uncharacterized protein (TIGR00730 family)
MFNTEDIFDIHLDDPWRMFRIMAEFVDGFETLSQLGPSVSVFGSARDDLNSQYYDLATDVTTKIAEKGFSITTGGGPGIMEVVNKAAQQAGAPSSGLCINLPFESRPNDYIDEDLLLKFRYFFIRKVMFVRYALGFVVLPGGFGTLDEFFEAITLIQTKKTRPFPVYLVGTKYWKGLWDWFYETALAEKTISKEDLDLVTLTDDAQSIADGIETHYNYILKLKHMTNM